MIELRGDKEVDALFTTLKDKTLKTALRRSSRAGCKLVQTEAKARCPVDKGTLRKSIKVRALARKRFRIGSRCTSSFPDSEAFYGTWVEAGHTTPSGTKVEGQHFMRDAAEAVEEQVLQVVNDTIAEEIQKAG